MVTCPGHNNEGSNRTERVNELTMPGGSYMNTRHWNETMLSTEIYMLM